MNDAGSMDARTPRDFPERLDRLRSLTGLSWVAFAGELGVRHERVLRWREGARPNDRGMASLCRLAARVPGGMDALFGGGGPDRPRTA